MPLVNSQTDTMIQPKVLAFEKLFEEVRTRMAPSPTGFLHIGNLRTALYAYLAAKHYKGKFLLRIEDTDRARIVKGAINNIFDILKWVGIEPDEHSTFNTEEVYIGDNGKYGPYVQSQRLDIYKQFVHKLLDEEKAYYCFCTSERLEKMRAEQTANKMITRYDRNCRNLSTEEIKENLDKKIPYVIRFKTSTEGETIFNDLIRGEIKVKNSVIDDYILLKTDRFPTYHLASVVDDHLMEITHIIRGEEWLATAPLHKMLYKAFSWETPLFAHLPSILGADKKKLSKRTGDVAVSQYIEKGYLPEAIINFILLLGWNPGTEKEFFTREEMISEFTLEKVGKSGAIFDPAKLDWINGHYIRKTELDELTNLCIPYLIRAELIVIMSNDKLQMTNQFQNPNVKIQSLSLPLLGGVGGGKFKIVKTGEEVDFDWLKKVVALEQERMKKLSDIAESTKYFFVDVPEYDVKLIKWKKSTLEQAKLNLQEIADVIENLETPFPSKTDYEAALKPLMEKLGVGDTLWPLRVALSGAKFSPNPFEIAEVLGKEKVLRRIKAGIGK